MNEAINGGEKVEIVATFGSGRLVKTRAGKYRFDGGTFRDQLEALEWASMFSPEAVFFRRGANDW